MNGHRKVRLLLYDYVRGGLRQDESRMVERHIAACADCAREAESHRELLKAVPGPTARPSDALPDSYWTGFANDVMGKVDAGPSKRPGLAGRLFGGEDTARIGASYGPWRIAAGLAAAAAVVAVVWFAAPGTDDALPAIDGTGSRTADTGPDLSASADTLTDFDRRLSDYFRKSKTLLVGVSNIEPSDGGEVDLDAERRISQTLLREARYLRSGPVDPRASRLIDDLDRILIGLANGERAASGTDIQMLRGGIASRNLLFKLRMQETRQYGLPVQTASYQR
jgi:hypothetical protein